MEVNLRPCLRAKYGRTLQTRVGGPNEMDEKNKQILRNMWWLVGLGLSIFLGGFALWTVDNNYCSTLRGWRHEIGLPWGILLEGHGWWSVQHTPDQCHDSEMLIYATLGIS